MQQKSVVQGSSFHLKNVFIQSGRPDSLSFHKIGFLSSLFLPPRNLVFSARDGHQVASLHLAHLFPPPLLRETPSSSPSPPPSSLPLLLLLTFALQNSD